MMRDTLVQTVANNIEAAMQARGINASELARKAHINPTGVYDILSGKSRSPRLDTIGKLAGALGMPVMDLLSDREAGDQRAEIARLFAQLDPQERRRLLVTARAWLAERTPDEPANRSG